MSALNRLRERLAGREIISVAEYMACCNQHYYATRDPFGAAGDFTTAPEVSQIFGELIGAWLADSWQHMGSPNALLCEIGPGRGTLMKDILRATRHVAAFHASTCLRLVENSPTLTALQQRTLREMHQDMGWLPSPDSLPSLPLLLVANEFFDALPIVQEVHTANGWQERCVAEHNSTLAFTPEGDAIRERSPAVLAVADIIYAHIKRFGGVALFIDYGYGSGESGDTLQAVRQHAYCSPLEFPGEADITAHVDFAALARRTKEHGLHCFYTTQGEFLRRLGAELRAAALCRSTTDAQRHTILAGLERLISPEHMGQLFKVLAISTLPDPPAGFTT